MPINKDRPPSSVKTPLPSLFCLRMALRVLPLLERGTTVKSCALGVTRLDGRSLHTGWWETSSRLLGLSSQGEGLIVFLKYKCQSLA